MSETQSLSGACLCGAVRFTVPHAATHVDACHCSMCRRWGGGPLMAVECGTEVNFEATDCISRFSSSDWAERAFCSRCGTHLFYRFRESGAYMLPAGVLDSNRFAFTTQIFIDEKPDYYTFANDTRNLTGAEVFALYAPPEN